MWCLLMTHLLTVSIGFTDATLVSKQCCKHTFRSTLIQWERYGDKVIEKAMPILWSIHLLFSESRIQMLNKKDLTLMLYVEKNPEPEVPKSTKKYSDQWEEYGLEAP